MVEHGGKQTAAKQPFKMISGQASSVDSSLRDRRWRMT
jgi:hypothetical protein